MNLSRRIRKLIRSLPFNTYLYHFIHIPKNGGISIRDALVRHRDVSLSDPLHARYRDVVGKAGNLRYFCIVRNPWERVVSRFFYARQSAENWPDDDPRKAYFLGASFATFVSDHRNLETPAHPGEPWLGPHGSWFNQLFWISDDSGAVRCDCIDIRTMTTDLSAYLGRTLQLGHRNISKRPRYLDVYEPWSRDLVGELYADDIEYFGFSFEGGPTKNCWRPSQP